MNRSLNINIKLWLLATIAITITACEHADYTVPVNSGHTIGLQTTELNTRSYSATSDGSTFGIYAFTCPDGTFDIQSPDRLYNVKATQINGVWVYAPPAQWPDDTEKVQFFAYTPHSSTVAPGAIVVSPAEQQGIPTITLTLGIEKGPIDFALSKVHVPISRIPANTEEDWMKIRESDHVNFRFDRQLSEVAFRGKYIRGASEKESNTRLFINYMTIKNVIRSATFSYDSNNSNATNGITTYKITPRGEVDGVTGATINLSNSALPIATNDYMDLNNPDSSNPHYLRMIPQTYDHVELIINYTLEYMNGTDIYEFYVTGEKRIPLTVNWERGKRYIYDLEFYFSEVIGLNPRLSVKVTDWTETEVTIPID